MTSKEMALLVRKIQIRTGKLVHEVFAGQYESVFKGHGMEFSEVREYAPGDDVRSIDRNVSARLGKPYIKKYVEERELTVMLMVDLSRSSRFGTRDQFKRALLAELSGLLAFTAVHNKDKVGLLTFAGGVLKYLPPKKGRSHALVIVREILAEKETGTAPPARFAGAPTRRGPQVSHTFRGDPFISNPDSGMPRPLGAAEPGTRLDLALEYLNSVLKRKAVVFILSDFFTEGHDRALKITARHHDVIAVRLTDPREKAWPDAGLVEFEDRESGARTLLDTGDPAVREAFARTSANQEAAFHALMKAARTDVIELTTGSSFIPPLIKFFKEREKRFR